MHLQRYREDAERQTLSKGVCMKKKILVLFIVAILAAVPAMADDIELPFDSVGTSEKGTWGVGLNLGTNLGATVKYGYGIFDIYGNVGLSFIGGLGVTVEPGVDFVVYDVDFGGGHHMPITVGAMIPVGIFIGNTFGLNISTLVSGGLHYKIPDVPVSFYLRLGLGLRLDIMPSFGLGFGYSGAIGVLYEF